MLGLLGTIWRRSSRLPPRSLLQVEELEPRLVMSTAPKVILISLDGAAPYIEDPLIAQGLLPGLATLKNNGVEAQQNLTVTPSLTAPGHIAIATGSNANN